jgi:hypothetical protein
LQQLGAIPAQASLKGVSIDAGRRRAAQDLRPAAEARFVGPSLARTARLALTPTAIIAVIARSRALPIGGSSPSCRIIVAVSQ